MTHSTSRQEGLGVRLLIDLTLRFVYGGYKSKKARVDYASLGYLSIRFFFNSSVGLKQFCLCPLFGGTIFQLDPEELQRPLQPSLETDSRFPPQRGSGFGDLRTAASRVVLRQGLKPRRALRSGYL